jgi:protein-disulfide isomerase
MPTKAERKAQARADRLAREQAAADAAARRRRLLRLGGVLVVAIAAVAIAIAVSSSSSNNKNSPTPAPQAAPAVRRLLAGIPQSGNTLGKASAPVQVAVYEDLECPICREFTLAAENQLIANDVRQGRAKLVFRSLQTATPDTTTFQAQQQAAMAAGKQNKLWYFVELFYHEQGQEGTSYVTESYLDKLARQVPGLNYSAWLAARKSGALAQAVSSDTSLARGKGLSSTPAIVVQGPKASPAPIEGAIGYGQLEQLVKQAGG